MKSDSAKKEISRFRALAPSLRGGQRFGSATVRAEAAAPVVGELYLYDAIGADWFGGITSKSVVDAIKKCEADGATELRVYINSPGGDVFEGIAMHTAISRFAGKKRVCIDGLAASAASLVAMAGDTIEIASPALVMIHDPWALAIGSAADMREMADRLEKMAGVFADTYAKRTGCIADDVRAWMQAETWFTASEAVEHGFADEIAGQDSGCTCGCTCGCADGTCDCSGDCGCTCAAENCSCACACSQASESASARARPSAAATSVIGKFRRTPERLRAAAAAPRSLLAAMEERSKRFGRASPAVTPGQPGRRT
jgi:ATP-dependent Clp protease protease subunit